VCGELGALHRDHAAFGLGTAAGYLVDVIEQGAEVGHVRLGLA
jgi:hypothetical protein